MTKTLQHNLIGKSYLPEDYQPSAIDVICARGSKSFYHSGNKAFRKSIANNLEIYLSSSEKRDKSMLVSAITNKFCYNEDKPCRFIRFCDTKKLWYEISYDQVRQKVGQTLRDTLVQHDQQKVSRKKQCRVRRASTKHCVPTNANCHISQSFATTSAHPDEELVHSEERDHVAVVSANPPAICIKCRLSILSKGHSPHREAVPPPIQELMNANSHGHQLCPDISLANREWAASADKALKAANGPYSLDCGHDALDSDSDTKSVSSCHWFQDCDETSLTSCDWMEDYDGNFWK